LGHVISNKYVICVTIESTHNSLDFFLSPPLNESKINPEERVTATLILRS
jgi:hypothetical protein